MDYKLIEFFGVTLVNDTKIDAKLVNQRAMKLGYIIHPDCCTDEVSIWLDNISVNYNSTFYKTWEDITQRSRLELAIDQLISYAINYGMGGNFDLNDADYSDIPDIRKYKVILPISKEELFEKCCNVLYSGIALKQDTMVHLVDFIADCILTDYDCKLPAFNVDSIKNREALCYLIDHTGMMPSDPASILRYIHYKVTGETQIVKDKNIINRYKISGCHFNLDKLEHCVLEKLASIFYRYKPVFLGLGKQSKANKVIVNKLRRMAVKNHKPFRAGFWENIVSNPVPLPVLQVQLGFIDGPSNFKLIRLIQAIRENRMKVGAIGDIYSMYSIRNGRVWFKKEDVPVALSQKYDWWDALETMLYQELVKRLSKKACTVKLPEDLQLTCPTSEKTFIGNIPFGSYYDMQPHNMLGIYWREEWGTRDFDLSFIDYNGNKIGWNADFKLGRKIIYSGDMTHADPEASEVIYMNGECPNGMIKVNRYSGSTGSKFIFCVAQNRVDSLPHNYMVDPNTIKFQSDIISTDAESMIGLVTDQRLYMCDFKSGDKMVSCNGKGMKTEEYIEALKRKVLSFVDLRTLLEDAGFKIRKRSRKDNPIELDLSDLKKDSLIELFS